VTVVAIRSQPDSENPVTFSEYGFISVSEKALFSMSNLPVNYPRQRMETGLLTRRMIVEVLQACRSHRPLIAQPGSFRREKVVSQGPAGALGPFRLGAF
jgi:hypothetical protein